MSTLSRIWSTQASAYVGQRVKMAGWLHRLRRLGGISFLILRDGFGLFQAVIRETGELDKLRAVMTESVIEIEGRIVAEPQAPGGLEMHDCQVELVTPVSEPLPFEINKKICGFKYCFHVFTGKPMIASFGIYKAPFIL